MSLFVRSSALGAVSVAALIAASSAAQAGAFGLREQSAEAQGYSFAGAASGSGGLSSMYWNPATITMAPGWQSQASFSVIVPRVDINPLPPTPTIPFGASGDIGEDAVIPTSFSSYQFNDYLWLGLSSSAPFGLVTDPRQNWAGQVYSRSSKIFSFNVNPIVGVKVAPWLSLAAGPSLQYFDIRLKRATGVAPNAPSVILDGDDVGFGYTLGATVTPFAGTTIGIGFRSSVHQGLEGSLDAPAAVLAPDATQSPITANLKTPEQVTVGLSQMITPAMTVHAGFEWTNWSRLKEPAIVGPTGAISSLPLHYDDGFFYSLGLDYKLNSQWTLRAGVAYEQSPIDTQVRGTRLPDNDRYWASVGAAYQWNEHLSFDFAYTHIFAKDTAIRILPGHQDFAGLPFVADVDSKVDIVSVGLRYRWDNPQEPIPAPIVRKY
jgi:long-chain fatty acid transport protein